MPQHIAPAIRAREEKEEAMGIIIKLDSVAVATAKLQEAAGVTTKVTPIGPAIVSGI